MAKQLNLIDVREVDEVEAGHIPGIINIPLGLLEFRMHDLIKKNHILWFVVLVDAVVKQQTSYKSQGFDVTNMVGGMLAWDGEVNKLSKIF